MKIPCPICIPCADESDSPVLNLSAEEPDQERFFNFGSTEPWVWPPLECPDCEGFPVYDFCTTTAQEAFGIPMDIWLQICTHNRITENPDGGFNQRPVFTRFFSNPQSVALACPDGSLFAYTTPMGLAISKIDQANADAIALSYAKQIAKQKRCCLANLTTFGCINQPYSATTTVVGGTPPYRYDIVAGSLPPGLFPKDTVNNELLIQGTPYISGDFSFTVRGQDSAGSSIDRTFTISILQVANTIPTGTVGVAFSYSLVSTGGDAPRTFTLVGGALPSGLSLSQFGTISGTPTTAESTDFFVKVVDGNGSSCTFELQMTVNPSVCPVWANLTWGVPTLLTLGTGVATFTPNSANSDSFDCLANGPALLDAATSQNTASFSYNGTGCSCRLDFVMDKAGNPGDLAGGVSISIVPFQLLLVNTTPNGAGTVFFSLPNTGGIPMVITITVQAQVRPIVIGGPYHIHMTGTFSNV